MLNRETSVEAIRLIAVFAQAIELRDSNDALRAEIATAAVNAVSVGGSGSSRAESVRAAVRDMLRTKAFKPTGRNKPASEYLAQAAAEDRFPFINNAVDVNNLLSLETGLPVSLLDADIVGNDALLRLGRVGESYVFNAAGHVIELEGLAVICTAAGEPLGNAIKDSMSGKLKPETKNVAGFVWAPAQLVSANVLDEQAIADRFAGLLKKYCQATQTSAAFL